MSNTNLDEKIAAIHQKYQDKIEKLASQFDPEDPLYQSLVDKRKQEEQEEVEKLQKAEAKKEKIAAARQANREKNNEQECSSVTTTSNAEIANIFGESIGGILGAFANDHIDNGKKEDTTPSSTKKTPQKAEQASIKEDTAANKPHQDEVKDNKQDAKMAEGDTKFAPSDHKPVEEESIPDEKADEKSAVKQEEDSVNEDKEPATDESDSLNNDAQEDTTASEEEHVNKLDDTKKEDTEISDKEEPEQQADDGIDVKEDDTYVANEPENQNHEAPSDNAHADKETSSKTIDDTKGQDTLADAIEQEDDKTLPDNSEKAETTEAIEDQVTEDDGAAVNSTSAEELAAKAKQIQEALKQQQKGLEEEKRKLADEKAQNDVPDESQSEDTNETSEEVDQEKVSDSVEDSQEEKQNEASEDTPLDTEESVSHTATLPKRPSRRETASAKDVPQAQTNTKSSSAHQLPRRQRKNTGLLRNGEPDHLSDNNTEILRPDGITIRKESDTRTGQLPQRKKRKKVANIRQTARRDALSHYSGMTHRANESSSSLKSRTSTVSQKVSTVSSANRASQTTGPVDQAEDPFDDRYWPTQQEDTQDDIAEERTDNIAEKAPPAQDEKNKQPEGVQSKAEQLLEKLRSTRSGDERTEDLDEETQRRIEAIRSADNMSNFEKHTAIRKEREQAFDYLRLERARKKRMKHPEAGWYEALSIYKNYLKTYDGYYDDTPTDDEANREKNSSHFGSINSSKALLLLGMAAFWIILFLVTKLIG